VLDMTTFCFQLRKSAVAAGYTPAQGVYFLVNAVDINPDGSFVTKQRLFAASHSSKPPAKRFLVPWYQPDTNTVWRWFKDNDPNPQKVELVPDVFETRG